MQTPALRQGDILRGLVVPALADSIGERLGEISSQRDVDSSLSLPLVYVPGDWIVLDASCDIEHQPEGRRPLLSQVLVARVVTADGTGLGTQVAKELEERREMLRQGLAHSKFLLSAFEQIEPAFPLSYVDYSSRFTVPHGYLVAFAESCGPRLRMQHPFRERFGNWVGAAISRIGIEEGMALPRFATLQGGKPLKTVLAVEPHRGA